MVESVFASDTAALAALVELLAHEPDLAITAKQCARLAQLRTVLPWSAQLAAILPNFQSAAKARQAYAELMDSTLAAASQAIDNGDAERYQYSCAVLNGLVSGLGRKADDKVHVPVSKAVAIAKRGVSRSLAGAQKTTLASLGLVSALVSNGQRRVLPWAWPICDVVEAALRISDAWSDVFVAACKVVETCAGLGVGVACRLFDSLTRPKRLRDAPHECLALVGALHACVEAANGYANDAARDDFAVLLLQNPTGLLSAHGSAVDVLGLLAATTDNTDVRRQCWAALKALTSTWRVAAAARRALAGVELACQDGRAATAPAVTKHGASASAAVSTASAASKKLKMATAPAASSPPPPSAPEPAPSAPEPAPSAPQPAPSAPQPAPSASQPAPRLPVPRPAAPSSAPARASDDDDDIPDIV